MSAPNAENKELETQTPISLSGMTSVKETDPGTTQIAAEKNGSKGEETSKKTTNPETDPPNIERKGAKLSGSGDGVESDNDSNKSTKTLDNTDVDNVKTLMARFTGSWFAQGVKKGIFAVGSPIVSITINSYNKMLELFTKLWEWFYGKTVKVKIGISLVSAMSVAASWHLVRMLPIHSSIRYIVSLWRSPTPPPPPAGLGGALASQIYSYWSSISSGTDKTTKFLYTTYQAVLSYFNSGTSTPFILGALLVACVSLVIANKYYSARTPAIMNYPMASSFNRMSPSPYYTKRRTSYSKRRTSYPKTKRTRKQ